MKIELRELGSIRPYKDNPRLNDGAVEAVAAALKEFGFRQPIVIDKAGVIVVGHTRWKAAKAIGLKKVPVHVAADLTPPQLRAYRIADNQTATIAEWETSKLAAELAALDAIGYDLELLGFGGGLTAAMDGAPKKGLTSPDETPAAKPTSKTRPGDLFILGEHRLLCGDSRNAKDVERVMEGKKAALVSTDPPYLVDYTGKRGNGRGKDWSATYREIDITNASVFFELVFANIRDVMAPHAALYCWYAHKRAGIIQQVMHDLCFLDHQQIVWVKPTPVFGRVFWHFRHEACVMGWKQGSAPRHDSRHDATSVWSDVGGQEELDKMSREDLVALIKAHSDAWEIDWEGKSRVVDNEHPTQKPVEIFARPMRKHTKRGDVCFEPFSGSGSQIIAAEMLGRRCHAIELEPVFVDVAVRRWEQFTGKKAERMAAPAGGKGARRQHVGGSKASAAGVPPGDVPRRRARDQRPNPARSG